MSEPVPIFPVLSLPVELRILVWRHYFVLEDGYALMAKSGKLVAADDSAIDLSLLFTCHVISHEARGLPLEVNTITFRIGTPDQLRPQAMRYSNLVSFLASNRLNTLFFISPCLSPDIYDRVCTEFPGFRPVLDKVLSHGTSFPPFPADFSAYEDVGETLRYLGAARRRRVMHQTGEAPSIIRRATVLTLRSAVQADEQRFLDATSPPDGLGPYVPTRPSSSLFTPLEPWNIPDRSAVDKLEAGLGGIKPRNRLPAHGFSATALAIRFLESIHPSLRLHVRHLRLCENYPSAAFPACHAQGLIPFCKENPCLRIERRVSLWGNLPHPDRYDRDGVSDSFGNHTRAIGTWLVEALALAPAGMPEHCFSLVIDCEGEPEKASELFQAIVMRDCAWQLAMEECFSRGFLENPSYWNRRAYVCFQLERLPEAIDRLTDSADSLICCNFDPGRPLDVDKLVQQGKQWTAKDWSTRWWERAPLGFFAPQLPRKLAKNNTERHVLWDRHRNYNHGRDDYMGQLPS